MVKKIECKKCEHVWDYKGNSPFYVTCPRCYNKVKIGKVGDENKENKNKQKR